MRTRDFLLLAYDSFGGEIDGKTNLQKKVYFLGLMAGQDLGYGPHYYGPYSERVADANAQLKSLEYVEESIAGVGDSDAFGFEIARHDFKLTDGGKILAKIKRSKYPEESRKIEEAAKKIRKAGEIGYMTLSVAAKAHFILTQNSRKLTVEDMTEIAPRFGWTIGEDDLKRAIDFLSKIGAVP